MSHLVEPVVDGFEQSNDLGLSLLLVGPRLALQIGDSVVQLFLLFRWKTKISILFYVLHTMVTNLHCTEEFSFFIL